ncbi:MAG: MATE family efflux transporter [Oscillospiraceae bacterium]|jgi:putative MATE family efflux protein|nr:MATE family efflux transporter [Oscillospiraceae bacterium]
MVKERDFYKLLLRIALPAVLQSLFSVGVNMIDNLMVASLGDASLAGVAMANQLTVFLAYFIKGLSGGSALMIAQYWGKRDIGAIKSLFSIVLRFSAQIICAVVLVIFLFPESVMRIFTNHPDIIREGADFLQIVCISYIFATLSDTLASMLRSVEVVSVTLVLSIIALFTNMFFDYAMIFGHFGFPPMGVRGAALSTVIARIVEFCVVCFFLFKVEKKIRFRPKDLLLYDKRLKKDFLRFGIPVVAGDLQWGLVGTARSMVVGRMGTVMVTANSVAEVVMSFGFAFTSGLASAACVVIGKSVGEKDYQKTRNYGKTIEILFACVGIALAPLIFFGRGIPIAFYKNLSEEAKAMARIFLAIGAVSLAGTAYHASCFVGINRGAGDTRFVFLVDMICGWLVVVPATVLAGLVFHAPLPVVFFATRIDQFFKWIIAFIRLRGKTWIKNVTRDRLE